MVEQISPKAIEAGLMPEQVNTDVELRLRRSGIKVVDSAPAYLYVQITALKPGPLWAYSVRASLHQPAHLDSNGAPCLAETWTGGDVGIVGPDKFVSEVRSDIGDYVDRFINVYLAANQ